MKRIQHGWSTRPPTARQRWSAVVVSVVLVAGFAAVALFADRPLPELNALFPSLDAIVCVTDLITSVLLFAQLSIFYSASLLVLASGYLFTALIVIPHALTFFQLPDFSAPVSRPDPGFLSSGTPVLPRCCWRTQR